MHHTYNRRGRAAVAATAIFAVLAVAGPLQAREKIMQLSEDDAVTRTIAADKAQSLLLAGASTRVCEKNAQWIRLGFKSLVLKSYDSLVLTSTGGDRYVFQGGHWNDRSFSARALRGSCVDIQPYFASKGSSYQIGSYDFGKTPLSTSRKVTGAAAATVASVVVAGAGDICDTSSTSCKATSDLIVSINPTAVFTAGDNAYSNGTLSEYNARYEPTWGRFKTLTKPTPGNHDYNTSGATGYFDYFGSLAGDRSKGYYSWDVGDWHFVALNTMSGGTVSSTQVNWLKADLAANTKPCTAAYFHHPLLSRGNYSGYAQVKPFWDALYAAKADLVLVGHDHNYQRYAKMNPNQVAASDGIRQVLVGTGGRAFYGVSAPSGLLEVSNDNTYGVLKLTLTATGYTGNFVPQSGKTFTDQFTGTCNPKGGSGGNVAPVANFTSSTSGLTATFTDTSTDSDGTIASRSWDFGDGTTSTVANPSKTYSAAGTYNVKLTVTDNGGLTNSKTVAVTVGSTSCGGSVLCNGVAVALPSGTTGAFSSAYTLVVPAGKTSVTFAISGGTGDADMYVNVGSALTTPVTAAVNTSTRCVPYKSGNAETCTFTAPTAGTYYVTVHAYSAYSGVSLKGTISP